jgi:serine-type D-Ala-D-Ala carboxypeptidase/endopeptidase (penicillin-binding protein 4)
VPSSALPPRFPAISAVKSRSWPVLLLSFLLACTATPALGEALPSAAVAALKRHQLDGAGLSVFVQAVDDEEPLLRFNAEVPRSPASVIKLLTSYVALDQLGPAYRWHTEVWVTGPVRSGRLAGDLVLKGGGDPSLTTERFWTLLREIRARGIIEIAGDLVIDDTLFAPNAEQPGDFDGQPYRSYNVLPNALLVNYNTVEFRIRHAGRGVGVYVDPPLADFEIEHRIGARRGACTGFQRGVAFALPGGFEGRKAVLSGEFPTGCSDFSLWRSVLPAPQFADAVFRTLWATLGGRVEGGLRIAPVPEGATRIISFPSRPLAEQLREINKWSNNAMTRHLMLTLGVEAHGPPGTPDKGREVINTWLEQRGLAAPGMYIDNGSGLSRQTRFTAQALGQLLLDAWAHPNMFELVASMPIAATDGTMRNRFRGELAGRMHLKSGRLDGVYAIAGLVTSRSGQRHVVVVIMNEPDAHRGSGEAVQDAVLRWVFDR